MKSIPCSQSPNRIQRSDDDSRNVPALIILLSRCRLMDPPAWNLLAIFSRHNGDGKLNFGNEKERGIQINAGNRKPAIGFSAAAEPPFRATHSNGKTRCSENDCLSELCCFENSLLTSQDDGLIALKSRNFPNSDSILQRTFPLRLQKILNQNRIFHSLKQR